MPTAIEAEVLAATNEVLALVERKNPGYRGNKSAGAYYYEDVVYKRWWLGPGGKAGNCEGCIENADAREIEEDELFPSWDGFGPVDEPPLHPHCFAAGTLVTPGGRVTAQTQRWYSGKVVILGVPGVDDITVTPNHPILTRRGWVPAGLLTLSDEVLQCVRPLDAMRLLYPDYEHVESMIEQVSSSPMMAGDVTRRSVPVTSEAFHGDGTEDTEVHVVGTTGALSNYVLRVNEMNDLLIDGLLRYGGFPWLSLFLERPLTKLVMAALHASDGIVGGIGATGTPLSGHGSVLQTDSVFDAALLKSQFLPVANDDGAGYSDALGDINHALASQVRFVKLGKVETSDFSGHVYNLETQDGYYVANSIIVHNCTCSVTYRDSRRRVYV